MQKIPPNFRATGAGAGPARKRTMLFSDAAGSYQAALSGMWPHFAANHGKTVWARVDALLPTDEDDGEAVVTSNQCAERVSRFLEGRALPSIRAKDRVRLRRHIWGGIWRCSP